MQTLSKYTGKQLKAIKKSIKLAYVINSMPNSAFSVYYNNLSVHGKINVKHNASKQRFACALSNGIKSMYIACIIKAGNVNNYTYSLFTGI